MSVVVLADIAGCNCVEKTVMKTAVAETKVARILVKHGRQNAVADHRAVERIEIGGTGAFEVSLRTPFESRFIAMRLVDSGDDECDPKGVRVDSRTKGQAYLLAGGH